MLCHWWHASLSYHSQWFVPQGLEAVLLLISFGADVNARTEARHDYRLVFTSTCTYCILCKFENFISYCFVHHFTVFWVSWAIIAMVEVCVIIRKPLPVIEALEKNRNMFCIFYFFYYHSSRENQRYYSLHSFSLLFIIISYSFITDQFCTMLYYQAQCLLSTSF